MPKICYTPKKFSPERLAVIEAANVIIEEYTAQGYELTLRQVYYQFVSRGFIPNNDREYKNLGSVLNDARLAGLVDWEAITDRTRNLRGTSHWEHPSEIIKTAAATFRLDKWADQDFYANIFVEKDALVGIIEKVATEHDLSYFSCRGYTSQSELWAAGRRLRTQIEAGKTPIILHLGDHDPSGIDMTRDIRERLELFCGEEVTVERLALNRDQVDQYNPPPNPAKVTDSRAAGYIARHGNESWELDALEPRVIEQLITTAVERYKDDDKWDAVVEREKAHREHLKSASEKWDKIVKKL